MKNQNLLIFKYYRSCPIKYGSPRSVVSCWKCNVVLVGVSWCRVTLFITQSELAFRVQWMKVHSVRLQCLVFKKRASVLQQEEETQCRQMLEFLHNKGMTYFLAGVNIYTNTLFFSAPHQNCYCTTNLARNFVLFTQQGCMWR